MNDITYNNLAQAEPIASVIGRLDRVAGIQYAITFYAAALASDISVSAETNRSGETKLLGGMPCDEQMELRQPRYDALIEHLKADRPNRYDVLLDWLTREGRFADQRIYETAEVAVDAMIDVGARLMINAHGELEEPGFNIPGGESIIEADWRDGWTRKRAWSRYENTLRQKERREEIMQIIRDRGEIHAGSGWTVLQNAQVAA